MPPLRLLALALLVGCGAGELQPATDTPPTCGETLRVLPSGTVCQVCDGTLYTRVAAGPDGWCDYDGRACACHGHGVGDQCAQAIADFHEACYGGEDTKGAQ